MAGLSCWNLGSVVVGNKYGNCEDCLADHVEGHSAQCVVYPKHQVRQNMAFHGDVCVSPFSHCSMVAVMQWSNNQLSLYVGTFQ